MNHREQAEKIYNQMTPSRESYQKMGMALSGAMAATVDEIEAHLQLVDEVAQEYKIWLDASKIEFGASREDIEKKAESKAKSRRRSAGARALSRKYGKDAAERIIRNKTGKNITLKQ